MTKKLLLTSLLASFALVAFAPTSEAVLIRYIRFVKTDATVNPGDANRFHIGEVEAFLTTATPAPGLDNANDQALTGLGAVGSTVTGTPQHGADSALVDGALNTGAATWSRQDPLPITAQVDLGTTRDIGIVRVWQRTDSCCQNRLASFDVEFWTDGGGVPGVMVDTQNFAGQVATNSFASFTVVPEPSAFALFGLAGAALLFRRRR